MSDRVYPFASLFAEPTRNGLTRPKSVRGPGVKMVNMGEIFAHSRLNNVAMERAPLSRAERSRFLLQDGDLLFARQSLVLSGAGKCSIFLRDDEPATFESHVIRVRLNVAKAIPLYYYYFRSQEGRSGIQSIVEQGAGASGIRATDLAAIEVRCPPIAIQKAIANILGTLDDKIELNRRMNETLNAMALALFNSWFVDFDPVKAKGDSLDPRASQGFSDLFPESFDDTGRPHGWTAKPLSEIAEFLNGLAMQKFPASEVTESLPVIKISELRGGVTSRTSRASRNIPSEYVVRDGDFLFSWSGSLLAKFWTGGEGALNQHLFKVTSDRYPIWFCSQWVYHHLEEFRAIAASKATTMGHIQRSHLEQAIATCPPDRVLVELGHIMDLLLGRVIGNELESRTLVEIRDHLLSKLITGELRVPSHVNGREDAT